MGFGRKNNCSCGGAGCSLCHDDGFGFGGGSEWIIWIIIIIIVLCCCCGGF